MSAAEPSTDFSWLLAMLHWLAYLVPKLVVGVIPDLLQHVRSDTCFQLEVLLTISSLAGNSVMAAPSSATACTVIINYCMAVLPQPPSLETFRTSPELRVALEVLVSLRNLSDESFAEVQKLLQPWAEAALASGLLPLHIPISMTNVRNAEVTCCSTFLFVSYLLSIIQRLCVLYSTAHYWAFSDKSES